MTWSNALARIIACPIAVAVSDYLFAGIDFAAPSQWIAVGGAMAVMSILLATLFLDRLGLLGSSVLVTILAAAIVRLAPSIMPRVATDRPGSIGVGVMLGLVELVMFRSLFGAPGLGRGRLTPGR